MIYCSECGNKVEIGQKFCPNCGNQIDNKKNMQNSKNNKNKSAILAVLIIIVAAVFIGVNLGLEDTDYIDFNQYMELNPQELHNNYLSNEISAKDKYVGNYYYFSGEVFEVEEFLNDKYLVIRYKYEKDKSKVIELDAYFNDSEAIKNVIKGDNVTVYCKFKQRSIENYMNTVTTYSLHSCRLK